ncbi:MAG: hypothetical protein ACI808_001559 [Paraglaciecola sp.]|jgi:hypothetical protein
MREVSGSIFYQLSLFNLIDYHYDKIAYKIENICMEKFIITRTFQSEINRIRKSKKLTEKLTGQP